MSKTKKTSDATKILEKEFVRGNKKRTEAIEREVEKARISSIIYKLRTQANLTQKQLADKVGTTQSVISRLEDADYDGHSLEMLKRIASALHCRIEIRVIPESANCDFACAC